ncbi:MAG: proton-conducting transporter membrane subunit, partial [Paracoccaceae bacterium]
YLGILISTSVVFFLSGIIWVFTTVGTLDFRLGGIIHSYFGDFSTILLLMLFAFGVGKAALFPFHSWLPSAMVAPTPVSALLHAVAVVKAGVFSILKIGVYIFGIDHLASTEASNWLIWLAAFTILFASTIAISKDNLKARLAYSTVSQLSYIILGLALATAIGALGAALHIVMHAFGKITLFMTAGSIYVSTKKTEISDMVGLGRIMPLTFFAFFVGSLSIIGIPLLGGAWSKWYLLEGAVDADLLLIIVVLLTSSLMNVYYLLSIVGRGFFLSKKGVAVKSKVVIKEAPILCLIPPIVTAAGSVLLFFFAGRIINYLNPVFNFTGA